MTLSEAPDAVWVEGINASNNPRDVRLLLEFEDYEAWTSDAVRFTVFGTDLDISGVADDDEEDRLGHTHTSLGGKTMYGANNEAVSGPETYKWATCTSEDWWNNAGTGNPPFADCDKLIIYNKP